MVDVLLNDPFAGLWPKSEVDVIRYDLSTGNPEKKTFYSGLKATRTQKVVREREGVLADYTSQVVDVFYISRQNGELPGISEEHLIRFEGVDRKIITVVDQGGRGQTLEVITEQAKGRTE
jgi:hypothetical protein